MVSNHIWIAYSNKPPYLPVAAANTAHELAHLLGIHPSTVTGCWMRYRRGQARRTRYHRVELQPEEVC